MMRSSNNEEPPFSEDSRSSTDVEEALISEKRPEDWHTANTRPQRRFPSTHWLFDAFLLLTITGLLIERFKYPPMPLSITSDITGFSSTFTSRIVSFIPDLSFVPSNTSTFWDASVREKWLSIVPRGLGYVKVEHPEEYTDLPTPIHDYPNETVYTTAMPHQLHCLYNILEVYSAITSENPHKVPTELTFHLRHCFEYLRLSIMCCGDMALEGAQTSFPEGFPGSDGWDAKHVCRDYGEINAHLDQHRATDRKWIGGADDIH